MLNITNIYHIWNELVLLPITGNAKMDFPRISLLWGIGILIIIHLYREKKKKDNVISKRWMHSVFLTGDVKQAVNMQH